MKYLIIAICIVAVLGLACKKSSSSSSYFITASLNDTAKTFNVNTLASLNSITGMTYLSIAGNVSSGSSIEGIALTINNSPSGKPIVAGTYSESSTDFVVGAVYNPGSTSVVYGNDYPNPTNPLVITITSIDNTTVKGTFSGDLYYTNTSTAYIGLPKKTITNGQFSVKRQ